VAVRRMLFAYIAIGGDAATNGVAVALGHHVRGHGSQRRHEHVRPRQRRGIDALRLRILIQIVDVGDRPRWARRSRTTPVLG
jgi:hypothetical protein